MKTVQSMDNKYIKLVKSLQNRKYREKNNMFFDEGIKNIYLSLESDYKISFIVIKDGFQDEIIKKIDDKKIISINEKIFKELSDTSNSQGIIAVYEKDKIKNKIKSDKILVLDRLQDPGNVGTIIRTADAFGINTIYYTKGTVDIFSPKVVRSTMGSIYYMDFFELEDINSLKKEGYRIYSSCLKESISSKNAFEDKKIALVIGNEANGISDEIIKESDKRVKINMSGNAESLNAAIASGILIYEMMN